MRELDRLKVIQAIVDMGLKPGRAAERLGLSVRQVERLVIRYRASGAAGFSCSLRALATLHSDGASIAAEIKPEHSVRLPRV
ncbi:helix-turn-helix domain-containing protein [Paraburkholderia caffeinilytica]|uniref:helix-turn-helix domain-containing protein n=1 Tax=Paraburkholderia caffeinilytica TaxID=1761016 RepID=UPI0038BCA651